MALIRVLALSWRNIAFDGLNQADALCSLGNAERWPPLAVGSSSAAQ